MLVDLAGGFAFGLVIAMITTPVGVSALCFSRQLS
jgi:hypothetical protein